MGSRRPTLTSMDSAVAHHRRACWRYCVRWERPSMTCAGWTRPCGCGGPWRPVGGRVDPAGLRVQESAQVEGRRYVRRGLVLPGRLPFGYHHLIVHAGRRNFETLIIAAPRRAYLPPAADSD